MNTFFVVGLPRTRSAWLANFLTNGDAICHHELMRSVTDLAALRNKLNGTNTYAAVGDADPTLAGMLPEALAAFPEAYWVFVFRELDEAYEAWQRAFPNLNKPLAAFDAAANAMEAAARTLTESGRVLRVAYEYLDERQTCSEIHEFCLGRPMDVERWRLLNILRVTTLAEKAAPTLAPWVKRELIKQSQPQSSIDKAWEALLREMCGTGQFGQQAFDWLIDLMGIALTWDHLMDSDSINLLVAERAFEAMLLKWPFNGFWMKHAVMLGPVLSNAVAAWRHGDRARHFDCYSEPALVVAYALGGIEHVNRFAGPVHDLVRRGRAENDQRGTGLVCQTCFKTVAALYQERMR
jgi:hypothetical protein